MAINIERLLRLTADYHNFCNKSDAKNSGNGIDELSAEELDLVSAAMDIPVRKIDEDKKINRSGNV